MENLKHTKEYAEKLAKIYSETKSSSYVFRANHENDFISGYMKAIEETAAHDLLEALIDIQNNADIWDNLFLFQKKKILNAINKVTK